MLVLCLGACAHAPLPPPAGDIEAAYKSSYLPPVGYARVYIFPINHVVLGYDHLKVTDVYLGKRLQVADVYLDQDKLFITQIKEDEFGAFDIKPGQFHLIVQWRNVKIIDQIVTAAAGTALAIKPDWDKRPETVASSPLMLFGLVGGVIAGLTADHNPGSYDVVNPASAMREIQALRLSSVAPEAHAYVQQAVY
jgi:hypothetical protein